MDSYTVTSHVFVPYPEGETVTDDDLVGCDIPALIAGGHLTPKASSPDPAGTAGASTKE